MMQCFTVSLLLSLCGPGALAGLLYSYNRLALKDLDQMNKIIKEKIKESRATKGDKSIPLKEALQAVYSRPNDDFLIEKIVSPLRSELEDRMAWEKTVRALVKEAVGALRNPKAFKVEVQVTYAIFLENLLAEMKPRSQEDFEKDIITQVRDAKIELSKEALRERRLRMMKEPQSPSEAAALILTAAGDKKTSANH